MAMDKIAFKCGNVLYRRKPSVFIDLYSLYKHCSQKEEALKNKWKNIMLLMLFILLSPCVYAAVLGYWVRLEVPLLLLLPKGKVIILAGMLLYSAVGALICAFILAFPMGYLTKQQPKVLGSALGIIGTVAYFILCPFRLQQFNQFTGTITIIEHVSFIVGCILFTMLGYRIGKRKLENGLRINPPDARSSRR
jgi:hypothetical protein